MTADVVKRASEKHIKPSSVPENEQQNGGFCCSAETGHVNQNQTRPMCPSLHVFAKYFLCISVDFRLVFTVSSIINDATCPFKTEKFFICIIIIKVEQMADSSTF